MRILQVSNKVPYPTKDGGAIAAMNLIKGFSHLGHEVTVLSMSTLKHRISVEELPEGVADLANFRFVDVPARISALRAIVNLLFSSQPYNAIRFIDKNFSDELEQVLDEKEFDVIQLEGLYVCPYIPLIRKKSKALIVYRAHNVEFEIWQRTAKLSKGLFKYYLANLTKRIKNFETKLLNSYDVIVPITDRDKNKLNEMGNTKPAQVSQTGIDSSVLIPNARNLEYPSLFHIGSMEWSPNQEGLMWFIDKCWPVLNEKFTDLKFYVAGRGTPDWLQKRLKMPNVEFLGEVDDAYQFMNSKAIMVVPLFSGSGMRIKIIEGMALGKSIVSTTIGAEGIDLEPGKHLLVANNEDEFVEAISKLVEDKELFTQLGENAIDFIHEKFDNLATAGKLIDFYKQHL
ncbi:glycosyltransferase family 4 protein [Maribellus mangrovi]|uniref:glycosyltransferase family 4 protein n=1 Tax=Maribellus mangrovi TaxID=3133146 RepID=UPI0030ED825A